MRTKCRCCGRRLPERRGLLRAERRRRGCRLPRNKGRRLRRGRRLRSHRLRLHPRWHDCAFLIRRLVAGLRLERRRQLVAVPLAELGVIEARGLRERGGVVEPRPSGRRSVKQVRLLPDGAAPAAKVFARLAGAHAGGWQAGGRRGGAPRRWLRAGGLAADARQQARLRREARIELLPSRRAARDKAGGEPADGAAAAVVRVGVGLQQVVREEEVVLHRGRSCRAPARRGSGSRKHAQQRQQARMTRSAAPSSCRFCVDRMVGLLNSAEMHRVVNCSASNRSHNQQPRPAPYPAPALVAAQAQRQLVSTTWSAGLTRPSLRKDRL